MAKAAETLKPEDLTPEFWLAVERRYCTEKLAYFAQQAWSVLEPGTPLKWGWALDAICQHLEAVTSGDIKRLQINVPPGSMKSLLVSVIWPAWEWGPKGLSTLRYLGTAHAQHLALRDNMRCRRLIQSRWYQSLWPLKLMSDQNAKAKFENASTGFREAMAFTGLTGSRGDRVIIDDPLSADDANSAAELENARLTFTETLPTRVNSDDSAIVLIMQRLHERDTCGVIDDLGLPYEKLIIPMRWEPEARHTTRIGWTDPRKKAGELMFPERFSEAQVVELERTLGSYATAGQLQQRPSPRGGGIFQADWWRRYETVPALQYRVIYADTAQKTAEQNDFSVLAIWGKAKTGQAVLLDMERGKWTAPELRKKAREFWQKHYPASNAPLRVFKVEDKVSGTGLIQDLAAEGMPMVGITRNRDKVTRAYDVAPLIESGNVLIPTGKPWIEDFLGEMAAFPNGAFDDQVDTMMDAVSDLMGQGSARLVYSTPFEAIVSGNFSIPRHWRRSFAFEVSGDHIAALWFAIDPSDGVAYAYSEHDMQGMVPQAQAAAIAGRGAWIPGVIAETAPGRTERDTRAALVEMSNAGLNVSRATHLTDTSVSMAENLITTGRLQVFETLTGFERQYRTHHRDDDGKIVEGNNLFMRCLRYWASSGRETAAVRPELDGTFQAIGRTADRKAGY